MAQQENLEWGGLFGGIRDMVDAYRAGDWLSFIRHAAKTLYDVLGDLPQGVQASTEVNPKELDDEQLIGAIEAHATPENTQALTLPGGSVIAVVLKELLKEALKRWLDKI